MGPASSTSLPRSALVMFAWLAAGCIEDPRAGQGAGYVLSDDARAEVVQVAWTYVRRDDTTERASLQGGAPIGDGRFDLDVMLASQEGTPPPTRQCFEDGARQEERVPAEDADAIAIGWMVATPAAVGDDDLGIEELRATVAAVAMDVVVVWSEEDRPRSSVAGERLESALHAGFQLARLRPCRVPVECQGVEDILDFADGRPDSDLCVDPWPEGGIVLLQTGDGAF